jgi:hypothetical protein
MAWIGPFSPRPGPRLSDQRLSDRGNPLLLFGARDAIIRSRNGDRESAGPQAGSRVSEGAVISRKKVRIHG